MDEVWFISFILRHSTKLSIYVWKHFSIDDFCNGCLDLKESNFLVTMSQCNVNNICSCSSCLISIWQSARLAV